MYATISATADDESPEKSTTSYCRLLSLSAVLITPAFLYGMNAMFPTVAIPLLNLNVDEASWLSSVAFYVSPISSILIGIVIDKYGRKAALVCGILPSLAGWSLLVWNYDATVLLLGQMLNGLTVGAVLYPIQVYAGECIMVRHVRLRNSCMVWIGFYATFGAFVVVGLSTFLDYGGVCRVALAVVVVALLAFYAVLPESPAWLRGRGRHGDAECAEQKLGIRQPIRRPNASADDDDVRPSVPTAAAGQSATNVCAGRLQLLRRPDVYKPLVIMSTGNALLPFCGQVAVVTYMINIIGDTIPGQVSASHSYTQPFDAHAYGLVCAAFAVFGSLASGVVLPFAGVKCVLIGADLFTVVGMATLTFCSLNAVETVLWLRVAAISLIAFITGVVIGPTYTVAGDMFPVDGKGFACVPAIVGSLASATANKLFPYLYMTLGGYTYCVYAAVNVLNVLYVYKMLPEVVGKTLDEINSGFMESPKANQQ